MLSGPEERRLKEIEFGLAADDPRFVQSFQAGGRTVPWRRRWPYTLSALVGVLVLGIGLVEALPALFLLGTGIATVALVVRRRATRAQKDRSP